MYNVIVADRGLYIANEVINSTDWYIKMLLVDDVSLKEYKEKYASHPRVESIISLSEFMNWDMKFDIDFPKIEEYLKLFHIADYGARRIRDDIFFSHYSFYAAYALWTTYFKRNKIDFCINVNSLHGFSSDYMLEAVAKKAGILHYNVFPHFYHEWAIYSSNDDKFIENKNYKNQKFDMNEIASYASRLNYDGISRKCETLRSKFRLALRQIVYKIGGIFIVKTISLIAKGPHDIHYKIVDAKGYIKICRHILRMYKYIRTLYTAPDYSKNFIVYFLHFEPEAVITTQCDFIDSQLFYIRLLAQSLPEGYVLYVKEHPDTYKLNKNSLGYQVPVMDTFLTKYFYDTITSFKNVYLVDYKIPAGELIKRAKAISTIAGTVMTEAIINNVPVIMFAGNKHLYTHSKSIFCPKSSQDVENALSKIACGGGGYNPDYSDIQGLLDKYCFNFDKVGKQQILEVIEQDFIEHVKS